MQPCQSQLAIVDGEEGGSKEVRPRGLVGNYLVFSTDVMHVGGRLADEGQMASLTQRKLSVKVRGL